MEVSVLLEPRTVSLYRLLLAENGVLPVINGEEVGTSQLATLAESDAYIIDTGLVFIGI